MAFVSITRLRIRSLLFLPGFFLLAVRTQRQVVAASGFRGGALLPDRRWTFWTTTVWDSQEAMRAYITSGAHREAMPKLLDWCDEASIVHWNADSDAVPTWQEADARMRREGRISKVRRPSPDHATMTFAPPRAAGGVPMQPGR